MDKERGIAIRLVVDGERARAETAEVDSVDATGDHEQQRQDDVRVSRVRGRDVSTIPQLPQARRRKRIDTPSNRTPPP